MQYLKILVSRFKEEDFQRCALKLPLPFISPIMYVAPPFKQNLITNTQGLLGYSISELYQVVLGKKIYKGLH